LVAALRLAARGAGTRARGCLATAAATARTHRWPAGLRAPTADRKDDVKRHRSHRATILTGTATACYGAVRFHTRHPVPRLHEVTSSPVISFPLRVPM